MAVTTEPKESKLKLSLQTGINDKGEPVAKTKTYSNLVSTANDEDVYDVGEALSNLQDLPLVGVSRVDETIIYKM